VLEAAQQQLISFSIDEAHGLSPCEQACPSSNKKYTVFCIL